MYGLSRLDVEELLPESLVDIAADEVRVLEQDIYARGVHHAASCRQLGVNQFCRLVEHVAERGGIDVCRHLVVTAYAGHVAVVEHQVAVQIFVYCRRRQVAAVCRLGAVPLCQSVQHTGGLADRDGACRLRHLSRHETVAADVLSRLNKILEHEARHLATVKSVVGGVVHQRHVLRTLYQAVEVVGIDGHAVLHRGESECPPQVVGNERCVAVVLRQLVFVDRQHQQIAEVEVARLEHAHNLQPYGRLAVERYAGSGKQPVQQVDECLCRDVQLAALRQCQQAVDERVCLEQRLAV